MAIGECYKAGKTVFSDPDTGVKITRLTSGRYNSNHIYFTNNSLYDEGRRLVICSDRGGKQDYYGYELLTGEMTQLTDLPDLPFPETHRLYEGIVDGKKNRLYFFLGDELLAVDLMTLQSKVIYKKPPDYAHHVVSTCDGSHYVYTSIYESAVIPAEPFAGDQPGYRLPHPDSRIIRIDVEAGGYEEIFREKEWIAHVNVCPTDENRITFCHEGPWNYVDHRIWGMDVSTRRVWKICSGLEYHIGHEYWYADGKRLGFHGFGKNKVMGTVNFDDTGLCYTAFDYNTGHTFSLDENLIVGDGYQEGRYLRLWKKEGEGYTLPRALCRHDSTFKTQSAHVHPRFFPDGKSVLFTSDAGGYEQIYLVELPDFEKLPDLRDYSAL